MLRDSDGLKLFGRELDAAEPVSTDPDWMQARVPWIEESLERALGLPSGGWYVLCPSADLGPQATRFRVDGRDYVGWRSEGAVTVAPDHCPHMGAPLADGTVRDGRVVCPWHGLALDREKHGSWAPVAVHDDGVLLWVRPGEARDGLDAPVLPPRPEKFLAAVLRQEARCDPRDVVANRLDPWHGAHFHPHSFARLKVLDQQDGAITVRVVFRIFRTIGMEVDARFHCPEPRTIVMTIVGGEGVGSVVETHATPLEPGRTMVTEATLATSERPQFRTVVRLFGPLIRPLMRRRAHRLWVEDAAYAERRCALRNAGG